MDANTIQRLVAKVAEGDKVAYTELLRLSASIVRAHVAARVTGRDRMMIEDIVQDTLLAVHTKYHSYDPSMPYLPWLRTVAHHKLVDHWRRQNIAFLISVDDTESGIDLVEPVSAEAHSDAAITLERMFDELSEKQRRVVQLAKLDGKTMVEIAEDLKISVSDAKVTLHRAITRLSVLAQNHQKGGEGHAH